MASTHPSPVFGGFSRGIQGLEPVAIVPGEAAPASPWARERSRTGEEPPVVCPLDWPMTPADVLATWPADRSMTLLASAGGSPHARWTIFAATGPRRGAGPVIGGELDEPHRLRDGATRHVKAADVPPFLGGWIVALAYPGPMTHAYRSGERITLAAPAALVYDHERSRWLAVGEPHEFPRLPTRAELADTAARAPAPSHAFHIGPLTSAMGERAYRQRVARAIEYTHAGDVFQVNLAHRLEGSFTGSPRGLLAALLASARPWYGAYIETPTRAIISASPELFLGVDAATRRVTTRPMKGTRPAGHAEAELRDSPKDAAELNMIIDLMRNDLSRVCSVGSVRVDTPRQIERHPQVLQATATISGTLRPEAGIDGLLAAAFPPGSVTGAPKIRAMQIIDELEDGPRGWYCGSIGFVGADGSACFNVAIRTAVIDLAAGRLTYHVGAGIVADSDPASEWRETLDKARAMLDLSDAQGPSTLRPTSPHP